MLSSSGDLLPRIGGTRGGQLQNTSARPQTAAHIGHTGVNVDGLRSIGISLPAKPATVDSISSRHHRDGVLEPPSAIR